MAVGNDNRAPIRLKAIDEIADFLVAVGAFFAVTGFVLFAVYLWGPDFIPRATGFAGMLFLVYGLGNIFLAMNFRRVKPWTYRIVKLELTNNGMASVNELDKKVNDPAVLKAFGIEKAENKNG